MTEYECFGLVVTTDQGHRILAGGLCRRGRAQTWAARLQELRRLVLPAGGLYEIDLALAQGLTALVIPPPGAASGHRPDAGLAAAAKASGAFQDTPEIAALGASAELAGLSFGPGQRTGGVLGVPGQGPVSAQDILEQPLAGVWQYTAPGGPGFLVQGPKSLAEDIMAAWQRLEPRAQEGQRLLALLQAAGPRCYLVVCDGTGDGAAPFLAAGSAGSALRLT